MSQRRDCARNFLHRVYFIKGPELYMLLVNKERKFHDNNITDSEWSV